MLADLPVPGRTPFLLFPTDTCAPFQPFLIPSLVITIAVALFTSWVLLHEQKNISPVKVGIVHRYDLHPLALVQHLGAPHNLDYLPCPPPPSSSSYSFSPNVPNFFHSYPPFSVVRFADHSCRTVAASADLFSHVTSIHPQLDVLFNTVFSVGYIFS